MTPLVEPGIDLAAMERLILDTPNLEDWYRDRLLADVRSLAHFWAQRLGAG